MTKPLSWNEIRTRAAAFASSWRAETEERAEAQTFWNEFMQIFGIDRRRIARFERRARRSSTGGAGSIDLFWPGVLVAEHKSAGLDLVHAESQALDYLDSVQPNEHPDVIITSDFARMRILVLNQDEEAFEFPLTMLVNEIERFGFIAGYRPRTFSRGEEEVANAKAVRLMGGLYDKLTSSAYGEHQSSVWLMRLLFLLFGDDTGMWERSLLQEFIDTRTQGDGSDLGPQMAMLFQVLDTPTDLRDTTLDDLLARFPYVNGALFSEQLSIAVFDRELRDKILGACSFQWATISPAIFGSMFQTIKSREARRELGEHYTSEENILKVIGPLFLDELITRFESNTSSLRSLKALRNELGQLRFLDPACGCGNFLVVAYRELRRLELRIIREIRRLEGENQLSLDATLDLAVTLDQFNGIEIEEWPARIAETAMFLIDHQANKELEIEFGQAPDRLPLKTAANIVMGNALEIDWQDVISCTSNTIILGNPPFLGAVRMSNQQTSDRNGAFQSIGASDSRAGRLDYVSAWFAKAISYMGDSLARAAFVATDSLTQGEQGRVMTSVFTEKGFKIDFAHQSFRWTSEAPDAAAVHVTIIGFSNSRCERPKRLFSYDSPSAQSSESSASEINFFLLDNPSFAPQRHTRPLISGVPVAAVGNKPADGGHLIVAEMELDAVSADPIAQKYLRPLVGTQEMLHNDRRWCLWLVDVDPRDIQNSPVLRGRIEGVRQSRSQSTNPSIRRQAQTPTLFSHLVTLNTGYLALPEVSSAREYIPGRFYEKQYIPTNKLIIWPGADVWLFAILQSEFFLIWARAFAGRRGTGLSIAPGTVCNTFPYPDIDPVTLSSLKSAGNEVLSAREDFNEVPLATLYDRASMPPHLRAAHRALDSSVGRAYSLRSRSTEAEKLSALVNRYQVLTGLANQ